MLVAVVVTFFFFASLLSISVPQGNVTVEMLEELVDLKSMFGMVNCAGSVNGLCFRFD